MTNAQLLLAIGVPTVTVLVGIFLNNARFGGIDSRIDRLESRLGSRLDRIEADLRQFYHDLGRHEGEIESLRGRK